MATSLNSTPALVPPVICDFGWYTSGFQRLPEYVYQVGSNVYPPGRTKLNSDTTIPATPIPSTFTSLAALKTNFPAQGQIILNDGIAHAVINYTTLVTISGSATAGVQGFDGCTTSSASHTYTAALTVIYDQRFYVDSLQLGTPVTFDALDAGNLGLPVVTTPTGVTIQQYRWDFGNGVISYGPQASITYPYNVVPQSINVLLSVVDSLGRQYATSHHVNTQTLAPLHGSSERISP